MIVVFQDQRSEQPLAGPGSEALHWPTLGTVYPLDELPPLGTDIEFNGARWHVQNRRWRIDTRSGGGPGAATVSVEMVPSR